ncbi:unnamed protein product [Pieris brassicae]|uniref:Gustatory receptor n=1 Tax=Pieris brassicae TaxID=7116 RepID=A0A9P0T916_PIEBR|nr:unnamed protein product [Pieris brassicae]
MTSVIKQSLITILLVSRWFGITPVKWESLQLRVSKGFAIYGALLFCFIAMLMTNETFSVILAIIRAKEIDVENNRIELTLMKLILKELILFGYMVFKGPRRMAIMIEVLDQLEKVTEKKDGCTPEKRGRKFYYFFVSLTILLVIVYINKYIFDLYDGKEPILENVKLFMLTFCIRYACAISGFHFVLVALLIHALLASINEDLEEIFKDNVPPSNVILYKKPVSVLVNRNISPTIDSIGLTPAGNFGAAKTATENTKTDGRIRSISRSYVNYCYLARKLNDSEDIVLLIYVFKLGINIALRKTTLLVSRALNQALERNDLDQLNELRHLLKMLHLNRPVYSAFGVFNIGRPLVTAVRI